jgi:hypothetical protein
MNEKLAAKIFLGFITGIGLFAVVIGISFLTAYVTKFAWNETMPFIFNLKQITFMQGFWLNVLAGTLIKSTLQVTK